jgi:hypothetical protein
MVGLIFLFLSLVSSLFKSKSRLEAENAALRQQLTVLQRRCVVVSTSRTAIACSWSCRYRKSHPLASEDESGDALARCGRLQSNLVAADRAVPIEGDT